MHSTSEDGKWMVNADTATAGQWPKNAESAMKRAYYQGTGSDRVKSISNAQMAVHGMRR